MTQEKCAEPRKNAVDPAKSYVNTDADFVKMDGGSVNPDAVFVHLRQSFANMEGASVNQGAAFVHPRQNCAKVAAYIVKIFLDFANMDAAYMKTDADIVNLFTGFLKMNGGLVNMEPDFVKVAVVFTRVEGLDVKWHERSAMVLRDFRNLIGRTCMRGTSLRIVTELIKYLRLASHTSRIYGFQQDPPRKAARHPAPLQVGVHVRAVGQSKEGEPS